MDMEEKHKNIMQVNGLIDSLVAKTNDQVQDPSTYKYFMYIRKSTDNEDNQVSSLDDQKKHCFKKARDMGIDPDNIEIVTEKESAKESGSRPEFDRMVLSIERGLRQGILCWAPDRLSRNMKEGGQIIELVDRRLLKNLIFCNYHFEPTSGGKLTLAILFATAKNYSDTLADATKRGSNSKAEDIQWLGYPMPGYKPNPSTKQFETDEPMWKLLREGIEMALSGTTQREVIEFLNKSNFTVTIFEKDQKYSSSPRMKTVKYAWNNSKISKYFKHPFTIGIYKYSEIMVNMLEIDSLNFKPLMSYEEFAAMSRYKIKTSDALEAIFSEAKKSTRLGYCLLKNKVFCGVCNSKYPMRFTRNLVRSKGEYTLNFACGNSECYRRKKKEHKLRGEHIPSAVRAGKVVDSIVTELKNLKVSEEKFKQYKEYWFIENKNKLNKLIKKRTDLNGIISNLQKKYDNLKELETSMANEEGLANFNKHHREDRDKIYNQLIDAKSEKDEVAQEIKENNNSVPKLEEFFELANSTLLRIENYENFEVLDTILNEIVSNLRIQADSTSVIELKKPFAFMQKGLELSNGGAYRIRTDHLFTASEAL
jgi:DNA invertase Pin-like site-specific DNA recombinase